MKIELWKERLHPYDLAVQELTDTFLQLRWEHKLKNLHSPIEDVKGRVKSVTSILDKLQRKKIPIEQMEERLDDIAGIRVICQFVEDIERVAEIIRKRSDFRVKEERDYIKNMKPSGYQSYHMLVYYTVETLDGPKEITAEIQIRTMAMDFWATIEHSLQYKYQSNMPDYIKERLNAAAKAILALDHEMSSVRSDILDAQNSSNLQTSLVADILNNIEAIFKMSSAREAEKIQDEFYRIYSTNDLQQLRRFHRELDIICEGYKAQSVNKDYLEA